MGLGHLRRDCKWGKHLNYGKSYGKWMLAESIHVKSNKVSDLLFMDVIDAHLEEGRKASIKDQTIEEEPTVVASAVLEDEVLVQSEPAATTNLNLDLLALDKSLEMTIERGKARFLSWAAIMHPKDSLKPNIVPFSGEIRDISEESPMVVDRERLGFLKHYIIPFVGIAGGLCLAWKEEIELERRKVDYLLEKLLDLSCDLFWTLVISLTWVLKGDEAIGNCFVSSFSTLFQSSNPPFPDELCNLLEPMISDDDNSYLCNVPSNEEIKETLFSMSSHKSPSPDGSPHFFKHYWRFVNKEVVEAVKNFFQSGRLLKQINHTFIALIPKVEGAASVNQFKPISLCNVIYKLISKISASRLKVMLPKFISPWQGAVVPGRLIQDNSIIVYEVINAMKNSKGKQGYMALKMDMDKAYDRLEWSILLKIMEKLGFNGKWVALIHECISTPYFSILMNGSPHGFFSSSRGLRQGDPLSPFLFIIGAEILSRILHKVESEGQFKGFQLARLCPRVSHLLFANDLIIFSRASMEDVAAIQVRKFHKGIKEDSVASWA
uniref:Reverse transcriptase domain-containing protein n=1 Tax=Fagus sylvatica TaxID=28930 RepID=A0A2N9FAQ7_FAGSY